MKEQQMDDISNDILIDLEKRLGDMVSCFTTVITKIEPGDSREPPGDLHGTGSYIKVDENRYLLTCAHVANHIRDAKLCATFHGAEIAFSLPNPFSALEYPADVGLTVITENTWNLVKHAAQTINLDLFATVHSPIDNELMYVMGNPGELSRIWPAFIEKNTGEVQEPGIQHYTSISVMCKIQDYFAPVLNEEIPKPLEDMHFLLPYTPEHSTYMNNENDSILPRAPGLSGSLVWNTRYREITNKGGVWKPSDARVTGIVWGNSTKAGVLVVTPVEYIKELIRITRENINAGKPYYAPPNN